MKLYKYHTININLLNSLRTKTNWYSKLEHLNDPNECFIIDQSGTDYFKEMKSKFCACCFSSSMDNYLMWSHYADGHKGVCLEWEVDPDVEGLKNVSYSDDSIILTSITKVSEDKYSTMHLKKTEYGLVGGSRDDIMNIKFGVWRYENEIRRYMIYHDNRPGSSEAFIGNLTAIYFGVKASSNDIDLVKHNVKHIEGVKFKQVNLDVDAKNMSIIKDI